MTAHAHGPLCHAWASGMGVSCHGAQGVEGKAEGLGAQEARLDLACCCPDPAWFSLQTG